MTLALTGAHRVGKTTLARAFAEASGMSFIPSGVSAIFKRFDLPVGVPITFEQRMTVQEAILEAHIAQVQQSPPYAICDRCPIDFAAYTLADWGMRCTPEDAPRLIAYVDRCLHETAWLHSVIALVQPGVVYVIEEGKPQPNRAFQEQLNVLCRGLMVNTKTSAGVMTLSRDNVTLGGRIEALRQGWNAVVSYNSKQLMAGTVH